MSAKCNSPTGSPTNRTKCNWKGIRDESEHVCYQVLVGIISMIYMCSMPPEAKCNETVDCPQCRMRVIYDGATASYDDCHGGCEYESGHSHSERDPNKINYDNRQYGKVLLARFILIPCLPRLDSPWRGWRPICGIGLDLKSSTMEGGGANLV